MIPDGVNVLGLSCHALARLRWAMGGTNGNTTVDGARRRDLPTLGIMGVVVFSQTQRLCVCRLLDLLVICVCVGVCVCVL